MERDEDVNEDNLGPNYDDNYDGIKFFFFFFIPFH